MSRKAHIGSPVAGQEEDGSDEKGPGSRVAQNQDYETDSEQDEEDERGSGVGVR